MAKVAAAKGNGDAKYATKLATARFYFSRLLPQAHALAAQIDAGASTVMALDASAF
jgi:hypothetical protein